MYASCYVHMYIVTGRECYLQVPFFKIVLHHLRAIFPSWLITECLEKHTGLKLLPSQTHSPQSCYEGDHKSLLFEFDDGRSNLATDKEQITTSIVHLSSSDSALFILKTDDAMHIMRAPDSNTSTIKGVAKAIDSICSIHQGSTKWAVF